MDTEHRRFRCQGEETLRKLREDDKETWNDVMEAYYPRLMKDLLISLDKQLNKRGLYLTQDEKKEIVAEAIGEVWIVAKDKIHNFVYKGDEEAYRFLRTTGINKLHKAVSSNTKHSRNVSLDAWDDQDKGVLDRFEHEYVEDQSSIEETLIDAEQLALIIRAFEDLEIPDVHQEIFLERVLHSTSSKDLAKQYNYPVKTVDQIVWRVKQQLQNYLI
jgi:RNA polymerase sigma factor (sigma-70 family)